MDIMEVLSSMVKFLIQKYCYDILKISSFFPDLLIRSLLKITLVPSSCVRLLRTKLFRQVFTRTCCSNLSACSFVRTALERSNLSSLFTARARMSGLTSVKSRGSSSEPVNIKALKLHFWQ